MTRVLWVCYNVGSGLLGLSCSGLRVVVLRIWFDVRGRVGVVVLVSGFSVIFCLV